MNEKMIEALLVERKGVEVRGLKDRIKAIDEQLKALGYVGKEKPVEVASAKPEMEFASPAKPRRRKVS